VGDSKLKYSIVVSTYYWFSLVVSNTRCGAAACGVFFSSTSHHRAALRALRSAL